MSRFLDFIFGTNETSKKGKDVRLDKECRLFMCIHRLNKTILYAAKGRLKDPLKRGEIDYHIKDRLDRLRQAHKFIPDEVMCSWLHNDIEHSPVIDDGYKAFSDFLKNKKPEQTVPLRMYVFCLEKGLTDTETIPDEEFAKWCQIQDALQLEESSRLDLASMEELIKKEEYGASEKKQVESIIILYRENDQLISRFLGKIVEGKNKLRRIEMFRDVEKLIGKSHYYTNSKAEDINYLLNMPTEDMKPIHILACELLCDELESGTGGKWAQLFSRGKSSDLEKVKWQILNYHKLYGTLSSEEIQMTMDADVITKRSNLREYMKETGCYVDDNTPGGLGKYKVKETDRSGMADKLRPVEPEQVTAIPVAKQPVSGQRTKFADQAKKSIRETSGMTASKPANNTSAKAALYPSVSMDTTKEREESISRLGKGALLRKEIDRYKDCPEITVAQLEWAFKQANITADSLITNGTMIGSIMNTQYFQSLEERINAFSGIMENPFTEVEENLIAAYASILEKDIAYYSERIGNGMYDASGYEVEIRRMIIANRGTLTALKPLLEEIRKAHEDEQLMNELDQLAEWTTVIYDKDKPVEEKAEAADKWMSLMYLRHGNCKFIDELIRDIRYKNESGSPSFLYMHLGLKAKLAPYNLSDVDFRPPELFDHVDVSQLTWLDTVVLQLYAGMARYDLQDMARAELEKVQAVYDYFEANGKKVLSWIEKDRELKKLDFDQSTEKVSVYQEMAEYIQKNLAGSHDSGPFVLKSTILEIDSRYKELRDACIAKYNKPAKKKLKAVKSEILQPEAEEPTGTDAGKLMETVLQPVSETGKVVEPVAETAGNEPEKEFSKLSGETSQAVSLDDEEDDIPIRTGDNDDFGDIHLEFEAVDETDLTEQLYEPAIDDKTLDQSFNTDNDDDDTAEETEPFGDSDTVYYQPERDGKYPNPLNPDWKWENSHLYHMLDAEQRKRMPVQDGYDNYRMVCLKRKDMEEFLDSLQDKAEYMTSLNRFYRMRFTTAVKSWESSQLFLERSIWQQMDYIIKTYCSNQS